MAKIQTLKYRNQAVSKVLYGENLSGSFKTLDYIVTGLSENTSYQIRPYMIINGSVVYGNVLNFRTASANESYLEPRKIDMGMPSGVLWGEWNFGARSITDYGNYYGWGYWTGIPGGITSQNDYEYARYYPSEIAFEGDSIAGTEFDIVHMTLRGGWRMPTSEELDWLFNGNNGKCNNDEDQYIIVDGNKVYGTKWHSRKTQNMLFFPASGYYVGDTPTFVNKRSYVWSSSREKSDGLTVYIYYQASGTPIRKTHDHKYIRFPIRPVWDPALASGSTSYSFMAVTSSSVMSLYMRGYTGNYVSNEKTQASFVITYDLFTGASEYGLLYGPTEVDLVIGASGCRRVAMLATSKEVVKIITHDGNVWTKDGSDGGYTPAVGPEYVDLGLSVKWAKWNMGASSTKEYGGYYGWGDPTGTVVSYQINKYAVGNTSTSIAGNPKYDIATAKWGNGWRLPTKAEFEEMIAASNERWTYDTSDGIKKYIATFPNGRTLEIPYDGYMNSSYTEKVWDSHGYYWTADANTADITQQPYAFHMNGPRARSFPNAERCMHLMIRPVYDDSHSGGGGGDTPVTPEVPSNAVDLGLYSGNLWATYNVGATSETESGVYVAWGELNEKISEGYYKENYAYWSASNPNYGGYSTALGTNIAGTEYDIAHVRWGGTWHMPTDSDIKELRDQCTWVQETRRGVVGYKVTGPNGNSIFLPFAGYYNGKDWISNGIEGNYWCSTMYLFAHEYQMGYALSLAENTHEVSRYSRKGGLTVRPCMPRVE